MSKKWWKEEKKPPKKKVKDRREDEPMATKPAVIRDGKGEELVIVPGVGVMPKSSVTLPPVSAEPAIPLTKDGKRDYTKWKPLSGYGPTGEYVGKGYDYKTQTYTSYTYTPHPKHKGDPVKVGKHEILVGAMRDLTEEDIGKADILVPLTQDIPNFKFGSAYRIVAMPLVDYGGVPEIWGAFLKEVIVPLIEEGHKLLAYCVGSHGRTGTFLASLIALMESKEETPDPIAAARERHCKKCVESLAQARAIYALRGEVLPKKYVEEFGTKTTYAAGYNTAGYTGGNYAGGYQGAKQYDQYPGKKGKKDKKDKVCQSALVDDDDEWYMKMAGGQNWGGY